MLNQQVIIMESQIMYIVYYVDNCLKYDKYSQGILKHSPYLSK